MTIHEHIRRHKLPAPGFHHLHLNSPNPEEATQFYLRQFPSSVATTWAGFPALKTGKVYLLFTKAKAPVGRQAQTAIWHFGWHVVDVRMNLEKYKQQGVQPLPLYTSDEGDTVLVSSDTWPGKGFAVGLTKQQIAEARAGGIQPRREGGFAYLAGPDGAIVEYQGDMSGERFNHVHMYQEDPLCAQAWYEEHLNAQPNEFAANQPVDANNNREAMLGEPSWPALEREGTIRQPRGGVSFDDVALYWYPRQSARRLVSSLGNVVDHIGLSVNNLDAWVGKLGKEGVIFLAEPYNLGGTRAVMIEGPSHEALELVEE